MAVNFPDSPSIDDTFVVGTGTYVWDGVSWTATSTLIGGGLLYTRKTTTYTAVSNQGIIADTSGGVWTLTLPASPTVGDIVSVVDGANWATNNLTIGRNGSTIEGDAVDMTMDIGGASVDFIYDGTTWQIYAQVGVNGLGNSIVGDLEVTGNIIATGDITAFGSVSDIATKQNITSITDSIAKVKKLNGITFEYKTRPDQRVAGVIAQDVEKVLPEAVYEIIQDGKTIKAVRYDNIIGLLIEAIKEQQTQIDDLTIQLGN